MNSFFTSVRLTFDNRESIIKDTLVKEFSENVKEIQYENKENATDNEPMKLSDCTSSMCNTLEAIFLHGLKDSFLRQTISVLAGGEIDRRPEPNFWPPLLVILHKETIAQVQSRNQLHTDIGFCRSWIRQSLNDNILSSYVSTIRRNQSALNPYYKKIAFMRDQDRLELIERLLTGIETDITFSLPLNSSLLNQWTDQPLQLAGLYTPSLRACPITSGIDIASSLIEPEYHSPNDAIVEDDCVVEVFEEEKLQAQQSELDEDDKLQLLLQKVDNASTSLENGTQKAVEIEQSSKSLQEIEDQKPLSLAVTSNVALSRSNSMTTSVSSLRSPLDRHSFSTLLDRHNDKCSVYSRSINLKDMWYRYQISSFTQPTDQTECPDIDIADETPENLGFEIVDVTGNYSPSEIQKFVQLACRLAREKGLDKQSFICKSCPTPLGIGDATRVCAFTGDYYCESCMDSRDVHYIPAKILYNWDFNRYPVSKWASKFLFDTEFVRFYDLELLNLNAYHAVEELQLMRSFRLQLKYQREYLLQCRIKPFLENSNFQFAHFNFERIDWYSLNDFLSIGDMLKKLQSIAKDGRSHIINCEWCRHSACICEICSDDEVIFPFDVEVTYRCDQCAGVFHLTCLDESKPCPKCERKTKHELNKWTEDEIDDEVESVEPVVEAVP
ncbi:pleckstrin homology domain-containing family M member 1 [Bradysia coprophila]|uniref:pleckstrin homology domain-containing family M member 1 n=1 Tax=Bradysia coprophila TaxID=38358 RepID=UPI00187DAD82|nr:pleckstrin homology domain-containing family M member 1 [Bradysia coprophila]